MPCGARLRWLKVSACLCMLFTMVGYAHNDPLMQSITYDQPAQTVKQLLDTLSRQTGVRLFAPSPIDSEIVLVIVREMPLKELMDHLATVTDGEWFKQPDGSYHLVRTPKIIKERRQQDDEKILQGLKRALERKDVKPLLEPLTEQQARQHRDKIKELMREIEAQDLNAPLWNTPYMGSIREQTEALLVGMRLVMRLIRQTDLRRLLEIPVGERRVFSNVRGRFLLPLGFSVEPLLQQYAREHQLVYELWTHPTEGLDHEQIERFNRRYGYPIWDYGLRQKPLSSPPTRVYLAVYRQSPDNFECTVTVATEDLKQSFGGYASQWSLWASLEEEQQPDTPAQPPKPTETPAQPAERVEWSERSRQFIEAYRATERTVEPTPLPEILDPARTEPLSLIPSDVLRTFASKKGKGVVALLLDGAHIWWFSRAVAGRNELKPFLERLFRYDYDLRETESLLLLKPRLSSYAWGQRVDRRALSDWLRRILQRGYPRLEDYLSLHRIVARQGSWGGLETLYFRLMFGEGFWWLYRADMRFMQSLTATQIAQLGAGQELPLSAFSPAQREQLTRDIYFGNVRLTAWLEGEEEQFPADLVHVFYPDGLPSDAIIKLERSDPELGVFTERKAGVWSGFRGLMQIAAELHWGQSERSESWMDEYSTRYFRERVERYQSRPLMPARRQPFILEVRLSERRSVRLPFDGGWDFGNYELLNDGKPATLDALPKELKEKLEEYKKLYRTPSDSDGY